MHYVTNHLLSHLFLISAARLYTETGDFFAIHAILESGIVIEIVAQ